MSERPSDCGWLEEVGVELALGLLDGAERAAALVHVERCGACQAEVASLTAVGEQLLLLAPEIPPAAGFETRVLDRIASAPERLRALGRSGADPVDQPARTRRRRPRRPRLPRGRGLLAVAAAVLAVVMIAGGLGVVVLRDDTEVVTAQMMTARGRNVGDVVVHDANPPEVELDVQEWIDAVKEAGRWKEGQWWLTVEDTHGDIQQYKLALDESPVTVTLDHESRDGQLDLDDVVELAMVDKDGEVWCTAQIES